MKIRLGFFIFLALLTARNGRAQWLQTKPNCTVTNLTNVWNYVYASTNDSGIFRSSDSGLTWIHLNNNPEDSNILLAGTMGSLLIGEGPKGIFISSDSGETWILHNAVLPPHSSPFTIFNNSLFLCVEWPLFRSTDTGATWIKDMNGVSDSTIWTVKVVDSTIFLGTDRGNIYYSIDSGSSWTGFDSTTHTTVFDFARIGKTIFIATDYGVWYSSDTGRTLKRNTLKSFTTTLFSKDGILFAIVVGTGENNIEYSSDTGKNWINITFNRKLNTYTHFLTIVGNYLMAGGENGIWRLPLKEIVPGPAYLTFSPDTLNFGMLSYSYDSVLTCALSNGGSGVDTIDSVKFDGPNSRDFTFEQYPQPTSFPLLIGPEDTVSLPIVFEPQGFGTDTCTLELFCSHFGDTVLRCFLIGWKAADDVGIGSVQNLLSIFPNPISRAATIAFSTDEASPVTITVYDLFGNVRQEPFDGTLAAGNHSIPWNAASLPDGVYECVLREGESVLRNPIVISH
ncbi:MAG TPA: hypothetical protein VGM92_03500 [Candidatus Kapabacteria bacterium]|jgi:photosystem II stability/assembly factor-like uncharacterized protein